jgi:serine/threonine protein kinase
MYTKLKQSASGNGNLIIPAENIFLQGSSYYKVTHRIDTSFAGLKSIAGLPIDRLLTFCATVAAAIKILHQHEIIHGDLKPDNILQTKSEAGLDVGKLIDFDDSFFDGEPPEPEFIVGDPAYYSPEFAQYVRGCSHLGKPGVKSDIFSFGVILHEYFCGKKPLGRHGHRYAWQVASDVKDCKIEDPFLQKHEPLSQLVTSMLIPDPAARPSISEVMTSLRMYAQKLKTPTSSSLPKPRPLTDKKAILISSTTLRIRTTAEETGVLSASDGAPSLTTSPTTIKIGLGLRAHSIEKTTPIHTRPSDAAELHATPKAKPVPHDKVKKHEPEPKTGGLRIHGNLKPDL